MLWALYVCYLLLRTMIEDPERRAVVSAVFNIFAAFDIPLVYFSIWFFRTQHPQPVIGAGGSLDPRMFRVLVVCWIATLGILAILLRQRYRLEALRHEVAQLRLEEGRHDETP
jgi:heme exporter protein C